MSYARLLELGRHLSSRERARRLRETLVRELGNEDWRLTVDLEGVCSISHSFADELFAVLAVQKGEEWFREHVVLINCSPTVRSSILEALRQRLQPFSCDAGGATLPPPPPDLRV
ncbi:MAG: STAS-like domain-containing protein [Myxococcota bacterium]